MTKVNVVAYAWIFCVLAYLESAGYVYRLHRRSDLNRVSAFLLLWIAAYALLASLAVSLESPINALLFTKLLIVSSAFIGPLSLHFLLVVSKHDALARKPYVLAAVYLVPLLFSFYTLTSARGIGVLYQAWWGWDVLPGSDASAWPFLYFFYACLAMAVGLGVVLAKAFSTRDRLERKQMIALACFTVMAIVNSAVISSYGVTGSVKHQPTDAGMLTGHVVSLASLAVWLAALRFTNWRFKLLVRLPETFAGDLLCSMNSPLFLVDRDNVITFANSEAASMLGNNADRTGRLEGMYFHDLFRNRDLLVENAKRLQDRTSEHQICVALAVAGSEESASATFHVSMFPIIDEQDVYCGSFVMVKSTGGLEEVRKRAHLTNREIEVMVLLDQGFRTKEISQALFISELTAKTHIHNIYQKVGARSRVELSKMVRE